ncbi:MULTISPECIES: glutamine amidotransferase [Tatumella]|uniref:Glutamine amidotransferase n=1 Tax=Tatumella punctata TaxID=399969 RepID=A0ABW1VKE4_9GAMM|nr:MULTISPECIES: glutamine amidotransferase [unclassified Tatumella]MBS0855140.1 glutamine amidotransferase [Tatumella sp. JGM16]MBS0876171.1 glutamine amidotransferase [Tatumella sp. JGM82]MBS0889219.1 glutamine amidotransferase [Tatumella sp. JGM94]MBS0892756.1 glutamine amidotransferase [Tatumella sp. JGM130]MBS0901101.1 glutamine amidotransferase [Tatumella sp. JGM100]
MHQPQIIIVQTGTPPEDIRQQYGDLPDWFSQAIGVPLKEILVVRVFDGDELPAPDPRRLAIITGSWAMVTEKLPWSEKTAAWIRSAMAVSMPLFGVCYGHQLMAYALGGEVRYLDSVRETGCLSVSLREAAKNDPLVGTLPDSFPAHLTHMQTVSRAPQGAKVLADSAADGHQIVRYGPNAVSTQFHPEFTVAAARAMTARNSEIFAAEGRDTQAIIDGITQTPEATRLLTAFIAQYVAGYRPQ